MKPEIKLPLTMRGTEPLFNWLMDTAEETRATNAAILLELKEQTALLRKAVEAPLETPEPSE